MLNLFKSKPLLDDFYQANKLSAAQEPLLNIGAMLLEYNQKRDSLTLKSRLDVRQLEPLLNSAWQVYDKASTVELLDDLLELPNQTNNQGYITALLLQRQNVNPLAYGVLIEPASLFDCLQKHCEPLFEQNGKPFDRTEFDGIGNVTAWDIERSGLVARYAYNIGWISEEETMTHLKKCWQLAKANYANWADYYVAYMKARTLFFEEKDSDYIDYVFTLKKMYKNPDSLCLRYPINA